MKIRQIPLFATVVNGICYITAGNYEVVYEATEKLKKIYSVESKLEDLLNHPQIRAFFVDDDRGGYDTGCGLWTVVSTGGGDVFRTDG